MSKKLIWTLIIVGVVVAGIGVVNMFHIEKLPKNARSAERLICDSWADLPTDLRVFLNAQGEVGGYLAVDRPHPDINVEGRSAFLYDPSGTEISRSSSGFMSQNDEKQQKEFDDSLAKIKSTYPLEEVLRCPYTG